MSARKERTEAPVVELAHIEAIAQKIARDFRPREVILVGSYARGEQTADSDIDLLVVFANEVDSAAESVRIRRAIGRVGAGVDVVVSSEREMAEWERVKGTFFYYARKEGKSLYGDKPGFRP